MISGGLKTALSLGGALIGVGGGAGLLHSAPTIAWKAGWTCKNMGTQSNIDKPGLWIRWGDDEFTNVGEATSFYKDGATCYKK